jgi:membrane-bound lytic murein transglycosylase A
VAESSAQLVDFAELTGWEDDDHAAALAVFRNTCMDLASRTGRAFAPLPRRRQTRERSSSCSFVPS